MGRSYRLRNVDVRNIMRLIGEITELGRDPARWRSHMLERLLPILGARVAIAGEHYINPDQPSDTKMLGLVTSGWSKAQDEVFFAYLEAGDFSHDPMHAPVSRLTFRSFTRRRRDLVSDQDWYSSPLVLHARRNTNTDDQLHSRCNLPQRGWAHFISPLRAWGAEPFSARDRLLLSLFHRELGRLWRQVDSGPLAGLPPRLRQTLDLIFSGYSEKEMAHTLNVSVHTLHDFARRLYRHFGVSGRARLLTNPDCRRLLLRPALSAAYYVEDRQVPEPTYPFPQAEP